MAVRIGLRVTAQMLPPFGNQPFALSFLTMFSSERIDVHVFEDGTCEVSLFEPDTRKKQVRRGQLTKWRMVGHYPRQHASGARRFLTDHVVCSLQYLQRVVEIEKRRTSSNGRASAS